MLAATGERHYDQVGQEVSTLFSFNHGRERGTTEFDENNYREETYRSGVGSYYGEGGAGWRDW